jgi:hypothetical protein
MRAMTLPAASKLRLVVGIIAAQSTRKQNAHRPHSAADVEHGLRFDDGFRLLEQGSNSRRALRSEITQFSGFPGVGEGLPTMRPKLVRLPPMRPE